MVCRTFVASIALTLVAGGVSSIRADDGRVSERKKIEALIEHVASTRDAEFVRNGTRYTPSEAADFLRRKWRFQSAQIRTAGEFIEKIGTKSSTSGKPYVVRFKDGREETSADFLTSALKTIDDGGE